MEKTGKKNAAGGWLRGQFLSRITSAGMLCMGIVGCALGFAVRGLPVFNGAAGSLESWVATGVMVLAFGLFYAYCRRVEATWGRGLEAERRIGDLIDHAVAQRGCAFAHDIKEALGGRGNVDHVVMTPVGIWVVETKSHWLSKRRFRPALRQVAENVRRVRRHLETSLPVRGALVIADRSNDSLGSAVRLEGRGGAGVRDEEVLERAERGARAGRRERAVSRDGAGGARGVESRLHAIPGIVTAQAVLPRSAPGLAMAQRTESGVATGSCGSGRATIPLGLCPTRPWS